MCVGARRARLCTMELTRLERCDPEQLVLKHAHLLVRVDGILGVTSQSQDRMRFGPIKLDCTFPCR